MAERRRARTAEERLSELRRDKARVLRARMVREVEGDRWRRMVRVTPTFFEREGTLHAYVLCAESSRVIEALREDAVFALDTAMRLTYGSGAFSSGDIHAYLRSSEPISRLAEAELIRGQSERYPVLMRPWGGADRLMACLVDELPSHDVVGEGFRVVTNERLRRELIGAVGPRGDLFALLERPASAREPSR